MQNTAKIVEAAPARPVKPERMITELLTWEQICERFPDQWVCTIEMEFDDPELHLGFRRGRVVGHGRSRNAPWAQADQWWETHSTIGHYFTGTPRLPFPRAR
jgi:hypothetical protein